MTISLRRRTSVGKRRPIDKVMLSLKVTEQEREGLACHAAAQGRTMSDILREWLRQLPQPKPRAKR
jgi:hypothetical protein